MGEAQRKPINKDERDGFRDMTTSGAPFPLSVDSVPATPTIPRPCNVTGPLDVSPASQLD